MSVVFYQIFTSLEIPYVAGLKHEIWYVTWEDNGRTYILQKLSFYGVWREEKTKFIAKVSSNLISWWVVEDLGLIPWIGMLR